jgi:hypothetical protein
MSKPGDGGRGTRAAGSANQGATSSARIVVAALVVIAALIALAVGILITRHPAKPTASAPTTGDHSTAGGSSTPGGSTGGSAHPASSAEATSPGASTRPGGSGTVGPAGGPVPAGFHAVDLTFVDVNDGWALGTAPCASAPCTSILRTTDGGLSWAGIPAPRAPLAGSAGSIRG